MKYQNRCIISCEFQDFNRLVQFYYKNLYILKYSNYIPPLKIVNFPDELYEKIKINKSSFQNDS